MPGGRARRSAAAAAVNRIQRVIEDDSDEDSNTSSYRDTSRQYSPDNSRRPSSADDSVSSGNASDEDFEAEPLRPPKGRKNQKSKKKRAQPLPETSSSENSSKFKSSLYQLLTIIYADKLTYVF